MFLKVLKSLNRYVDVMNGSKLKIFKTWYRVGVS